MVAQLGDCQIIACTHSPVIGADFEERMIEVKLTPTKAVVSAPSAPVPTEERLAA
jgi:predicted ATPase